VGCRENDSIRYYLPPQPAHIHAFIYLCQPDEIRDFSKSLGFLDILANAALDIPTEEIIAASLRQMSRAQDDPRAFLVAAGQELAALLSSQYDRLISVLGRLT
jgi:hypothetical protein